MQAVIELDNLTIRLGQRTVLKGLKGAFSGRSVGLLGPNGAGKTTLLHTLLGFHQPAAGTGRVFGYDIQSEIKKIRHLVGYMPENDSFIADMTGIRFVRMMAELSGLPPDLALERAHETLFYVGLGEARYRQLGTYSLGMKQMAKLAQAIVHGPRLLILDEPTNGLDPPARQRMISLIKDIRATGETALILSSHLLRDVEECCEEVMILKEGELVVYCNLEEERKANRKFLELEIIGDTQPFVEMAERLGCECAVHGTFRIKMVLPEQVQIRDLYVLAASKQIQIRKLNYKRDSLQDIFLKAMEGYRGSLQA
ncbi:MAG TPA: ABC transporter ATP-binding protein [Acidobacteriota bacterium]|nr:ABC transporter ATP-binding protein [Acidobacteriota bacterium]